MPLDVIKIFLPTAIAFVIGILITPLLTNFLYRHKMWKKRSVATATSGEAAPISSMLHNDEERKTPRMGGIVVWGSTTLTIIILVLLAFLFDSTFEKLSFLSRNQTWLPLATLLVGAFIGLIDDYLVCNDKGSYVGGGLSLKTRMGALVIIGIVCAWWFFTKLGVSSIVIPFNGELFLGIFFIPIFVLFFIGIYSGGIIDGVDGLAGGIFAIMYTSYAVIAFANGQIDLAAFSMTIAGSLLAFLWFNIPPARFYLSETGTMSLTITLAVIAFLTKAVVVLPLIALPLIVTSASSLIQIASKKLRKGKKVFKVAPLHNHFQSIGWSQAKVTMRYWVIGIMCAILGVIIALVG